MAYKIVQKVDGYGPRKGLEGPFTFGNGRTLYYCPKEGAYWDPRTDFYVSNDEVADLQGYLIDKLKGTAK
jgi:hypothetical protein